MQRVANKASLHLTDKIPAEMKSRIRKMVASANMCAAMGASRPRDSFLIIPSTKPYAVGIKTPIHPLGKPPTCIAPKSTA